jgi:hypothetical protein
MPYAPQDSPLNLTAVADRMPWPEVDHAFRICAQVAGALLEICGLGHVEGDSSGEGLSDVLYVIASGYGVLRSGDVVTEFTAGDLLFVPRGCAHQIERLDGEIRLWRITLAPEPSTEGATVLQACR